MNRRDFINTRVRATIGDPIVSALPTELAAVDSAIRLAGLKYWTACPHVYQSVITVNVGDRGEYLLRIPDIQTAAFTNAPSGVASLAYYLGIMRMSDAT